MKDSSLLDSIDDITARQLRQQIWAAIPDWKGDELGVFQFLSGGYSNANYSFYRTTSDLRERYVLRVPLRAQPFVDRMAEAQWYQQLPSSIGVQPTVLDRQTGLMISPWVDGVLLIDAFKDGIGEADLVDYLTRLHRNLPNTSRRYDVLTLLPEFVGEDTPSWLEQIPLLEQLDHERLPAPDASYLGSCHNDLNPWNILVTDAGWITLDWEFAGTNDPLFDLISLHQGLELEDALLLEMAALFLPEFERSRLSNAIDAFWLREWAWATYQHRSGNRRPEVISQIATADEKLRCFKRF
jgi:aminoglycoside phosphotransferase (APT) family kinase protein